MFYLCPRSFKFEIRMKHDVMKVFSLAETLPLCLKRLKEFYIFPRNLIVFSYMVQNCVYALFYTHESHYWKYEGKSKLITDVGSTEKCQR